MLSVCVCVCVREREREATQIVFHEPTPPNWTHNSDGFSFNNETLLVFLLYYVEPRNIFILIIIIIYVS